MANDGITQRPGGEWEMDATAFMPDPAGYLKVKGQEYPIFSFLDIPVEDSIRAVKVSVEIAEADDYNKRMDRSIEHLVMLSGGPEQGRDRRKALTPDVLKGLSARQIIGLVVLANSIAAVPQKADESATPSESVSSAPALAVSTVGAIAS